MSNFLSEFAQYIFILLKAEIPCFYLDIFLVVLFFLIHFVGLKIFNYEVSNFYYISFFGLFPYRLIKALFNSETILVLSIPYLLGIFCLIWRYINFFYSLFFLIGTLHSHLWLFLCLWLTNFWSYSIS